MSGLITQLQTAKQRAAEEKLLPTLPLEYTSPMQLMMQVFIYRQKWEARLAETSDNIKCQTRQTYLGQEANFSSTPLHQLKPVLLKDMRVRLHHKVIQELDPRVSPLTLWTGKIPSMPHYRTTKLVSSTMTVDIMPDIVRCIPGRLVCTAFAVEDTAGWSQLVSLYNYPGTYSATPAELDTLFPLNTVMAIREPHLKMALTASHSHIRIDSPTDVVLLEPASPLLENPRWTTGSRSLPVLTKTANEWKNLGDKHFKAKEFYGAIYGYTFALQRDPSIVRARLNRSLANLRAGRNIQAVEDARAVLADDQLPSVDRVKAMYRCGQGTYADGKYMDARSWYSKCLSLDPTLAEGAIGIQQSDSRIKEQTSGSYDWYSLYEQHLKSSSTQVDMAEFQGPVEKRVMSHRGGGRGVVAIRDITAGELLVVSKPFAFSDPKVDVSGGFFFALDFLTNRLKTESQYITIQRAISRVVSNSSDAAKLLDLYAGTKSVSSTNQVTSAGSTRDGQAHDVDSSKIEAICLLNSFDNGDYKGKEGASATKETPTLIYIFPSYFNHSCLPNAQPEFMGTIMIIRAARRIKKGEEVMLAYIPPSTGYEERTKRLGTWFPRCDCPLCGNDRANGASKRREREGFLDTLNSSDRTVDQLRIIVKKIDATYDGAYGWFRSDSSTAHQVLALRLERVAMRKVQGGNTNHKTSLILRESIQEGFKALEALGIQVLDKQTNLASSTSDLTLPISTSRLPYDTGAFIVLCFHSVARFCVLGDLNRAEMWMRAALWIEGAWKRDTVEHFKLKWSKALKNIGEAAPVILDRVALKEQMQSLGKLSK